MLSAYDVMNDLRRQYGWLVVEQLEHVLDFIDNCDDAKALLEYLKEQIAEEEEE